MLRVASLAFSIQQTVGLLVGETCQLCICEVSDFFGLLERRADDKESDDLSLDGEDGDVLRAALKTVRNVGSGLRGFGLGVARLGDVKQDGGVGLALCEL